MGGGQEKGEEEGDQGDRGGGGTREEGGGLGLGSYVKITSICSLPDSPLAASSDRRALVLIFLSCFWSFSVRSVRLAIWTWASRSSSLTSSRSRSSSTFSVAWHGTSAQIKKRRSPPPEKKNHTE